VSSSSTASTYYVIGSSSSRSFLAVVEHEVPAGRRGAGSSAARQRAMRALGDAPPQPGWGWHHQLCGQWLQLPDMQHGIIVLLQQQQLLLQSA
jgi:hypothetical protein